MTTNQLTERYFSFIGYAHCKPMNVPPPMSFFVQPNYEIGRGDSDWGVELYRDRDILYICQARWIPSEYGWKKYGHWEEQWYIAHISSLKLFAACPVDYETEVADALQLN